MGIGEIQMASNSFHPFGLRAQEVSSSIAWQRKPVMLFHQRKWMNEGREGHISSLLFFLSLSIRFRVWVMSRPIGFVVECEAWHGVSIYGHVYNLYESFQIHTLYVYGFEFLYIYSGMSRRKSKLYSYSMFKIHIQCVFLHQMVLTLHIWAWICNEMKICNWLKK